MRLTTAEIDALIKKYSDQHAPFPAGHMHDWIIICLLRAILHRLNDGRDDEPTTQQDA